LDEDEEHFLMKKLVHVTPEKLDQFFSEYQYLSRPPALEKQLSAFFAAFGPMLEDGRPAKPETRKKPGDGLELTCLDKFFSDLRDPLVAVRKAGLLCNPWEIASLRRDEVRNAKVLAWLLDCRGSHGFGSAVLSAILPKTFLAGLQQESLCDYRVRLESCPDGDRGNRVDIEIDGENFYLIIEVKIDAPEGKDQLNRYCQIAQAKHRGRKWAVIYLTPQGNDLGSREHVVCLSWRSVADAISSLIREYRKEASASYTANYKFTQILADTFAGHIRQL
jgi:hypothetical protein